MIDREARDRLALRLRRLAAGRLYIDDFDEDYFPPFPFTDLGVDAVGRAAWAQYSDYWNHRLRGSDALPKARLKEIARWILFLHSDCDYEWPEYPRHDVLSFLVAALTIGRLDMRRWRAWPEWQSAGDFQVWPFLRKSDCDGAAQHPRFLTGQPSNNDL